MNQTKKSINGELHADDFLVRPQLHESGARLVVLPPAFVGVRVAHAAGNGAVFAGDEETSDTESTAA